MYSLLMLQPCFPHPRFKSYQSCMYLWKFDMLQQQMQVTAFLHTFSLVL